MKTQFAWVYANPFSCVFVCVCVCACACVCVRVTLTLIACYESYHLPSTELSTECNQGKTNQNDL